MKKQNKIFSKIRRDILKKETNFDTRFVTKIVKNKKKYDRKMKYKEKF
jgi:hypothetical protein